MRLFSHFDCRKLLRKRELTFSSKTTENHTKNFPFVFNMRSFPFKSIYGFLITQHLFLLIRRLRNCFHFDSFKSRKGIENFCVSMHWCGEEKSKQLPNWKLNFTFLLRKIVLFLFVHWLISNQLTWWNESEVKFECVWVHVCVSNDDARCLGHRKWIHFSRFFVLST